VHKVLRFCGSSSHSNGPQILHGFCFSKNKSLHGFCRYFLGGEPVYIGSANASSADRRLLGLMGINAGSPDVATVRISLLRMSHSSLGGCNRGNPRFSPITRLPLVPRFYSHQIFPVGAAIVGTLASLPSVGAAIVRIFVAVCFGCPPLATYPPLVPLHILLNIMYYIKTIYK
jgi:hypothetical protein